MSVSEAGTYHCAVAACGLILFGNGTTVNDTGCASDSVFEAKTFNVGETVTLKCPRDSSDSSSTTLYWIRLSGNVPESLGGTPSFDDKTYGSPHSSIKTKQEPGSFVLSLDAAQPSDTGFYYCVKVQLLLKNMTFVSVTFLNVKGPDSGMVWWFRSGLDSGPGLVYTQRNSSGQCDRSTEGPGPHKCLYTLSKTMSVSEAGTYHCAVAACGLILFGNGTTVNVTAVCSVLRRASE
ncbi:uncharacterized protein [Eucyclogobius newberryi]|uniref:uncharacterized protein n=1 Tax=Eucyclogobius newberryi TaxID=166745 RepID=UPI003B5BBA88